MTEANTAYIREAKNEAEEYLGRSITDAEWNKALPEAQRKLEFIIEREGDADGERRKPYYLGKLVEENIGASEFSRWLDNMSELNRSRQEMKKNPACIECGFGCIEDKKKEAASSRRQPLIHHHYTSTTAQKSITMRFKEETI